MTAPIEEQNKRAILLADGIQKNKIDNYQGVRINSKGNRFVIDKTRIWTLWDEAGKRKGQAAAIGNWSPI